MKAHSVFVEVSIHVSCLIRYVYVSAHVCACRDPMCASMYVHVHQFVNACICAGMCMHMDIWVCARTHTNMECLELPELMNFLI